jgi:hypothetical protein
MHLNKPRCAVCLHAILLSSRGKRRRNGAVVLCTLGLWHGQRDKCSSWWLVALLFPARPDVPTLEQLKWWSGLSSLYYFCTVDMTQSYLLHAVCNVFLVSTRLALCSSFERRLDLCDLLCHAFITWAQGALHMDCLSGEASCILLHISWILAGPYDGRCKWSDRTV